MPIQATSDKNILQVTFLLRGEGDQGQFLSEVVCYLRICDAGLETYYSHHRIRSRDSDSGPFTGESTRRMPLSPPLRAMIEQGVMLEFWSAFNRVLRISPARIGRLPTESDEDEAKARELGML